MLSTCEFSKKILKKNEKSCGIKSCNGYGNTKNQNAKKHFTLDSCPNARKANKKTNLNKYEKSIILSESQHKTKVFFKHNSFSQIVLLLQTFSIERE